MTSFAELLRQGASNAWLFIPSAIALDALHGLEPGHSKTMMAAFIVAIRGTVAQAALLGVSAAISHIAVVWVVALAGMHFGRQFGDESTEGWFQLGSAVLMIGVATWMLLRTWREQQREKARGRHHHGNDEIQRIDTGHAETVLLEVFEAGVPPRFRLRFERHGRAVSPPSPEAVSIETTRPDGARQAFAFVTRDDFLESVDEISEPHEFVVRLSIAHDRHSHDYDLEFVEHDHAHAVPEYTGLDVTAPGYQDAHELAHANDIRRRFANGAVTTGQIVLFGLTGGLIPCPASITVLLLCLQLKQYALGIALVVCFSVGLALTMVATGAVAALSVRAASKRFTGFGVIARRAPYVSGVMIVCIGLYTGWLGWHAAMASG